MDIYHYTSKVHLKKIIQSGELQPSPWEKKQNITPAALWLSFNTDWEPTASKMVKQDGKLIQLTKQTQHESIGLVRFVVEFDRVKNMCFNWWQYQKLSNSPKEVLETMAIYGMAQGADLEDWYACLISIPLSKTKLEVYDGKDWVETYDMKKIWSA